MLVFCESVVSTNQGGTAVYIELYRPWLSKSLAKGVFYLLSLTETHYIVNKEAAYESKYFRRSKEGRRRL